MPVQGDPLHRLEFLMTIVNETSPQAVSTVTFVTQPIENAANFNAVVVVDQDGIHIDLPMDTQPIEGSGELTKNGQTLAPGVDYSIYSKLITLLVPAVGTDVFVFKCQVEPA